jgi:hypothetical protein
LLDVLLVLLPVLAAVPPPPPPSGPLADGAAADAGVPDPPDPAAFVHELSFTCTPSAALDADGFAPECWSLRHASVWPFEATVPVNAPPVGEAVGPIDTIGVAAPATAVHATATAATAAPTVATRRTRRLNLMLEVISRPPG